MQDLRAGELSITARVDHDDAALRLDWSGASTAREPEAILGPYFQQALDAAPGAGLELHFEALSHFNSSTVTALIQLIHAARARAVPLVFVYDGARRWQKLSFEALSLFVKDDGLVEVRPR